MAQWEAYYFWHGNKKYRCSKTTVEKDVMKSVTIVAKGDQAKKFLDSVSWDSFQKLQKEKKEAIQNQQAQTRAGTEKQILSEDPPFQKTEEGIYYIVEASGSGPTIATGNTASVHYQLKIYNTSAIIDSSIQRKQPIEVIVGNGQVIKGWISYCNK